MRIIIFILSLFVFVKGYTQLPSTDIFVGDVVIKSDEIIISNFKNITSRKGYDNQPHFTDDGEFFYFSSDREGLQSDIYLMDVKKKNAVRLTSTPESEYSPSPIPGSDAISVVRVDADSGQHLYRMLPDGSNPVILYAGSDTIGYYGWVDPDRVLIYVLGAKPAIRILNLKEQKTYLVAEYAGRRIHRIPGENAVSFTVKTDENKYQLKKFIGPLNKVELITDLPEGSEDYAWLTSDILVTGNDKKLFYFYLENKEKGWRLITDLKDSPVAEFYRIAFDRSGKKIALVVRNQPGE